MTGKAVVETEGTAETTVAHHFRLLLTAQGELVNTLPPWEQPLTPRSEANRHAQAKGRNCSAPTATALVTQRTSALQRSGDSSLPVSRPLSNPTSSLATLLKPTSSK